METRIELPSFINNGRVDVGTWNNKRNHIIYTEWLFKQLGYKKIEDWYKINKKTINNNYGSGLLNKYNYSPQQFLQAVYPDYEWLPWKFDTGAPNGYWSNIDNHKKYADWLFKQLGYKKIEDWYKITAKTINNNYGSGLLDKYNYSPQQFLQAVYPDYEWLPWKFDTGIPRKYWKNIENQKKYADWLFKELGYKKIEDWYKINKKTINDNYGSGMIHKYNNSPKLFLQEVYPDYEWLPWKFDTGIPRKYWKNIENQKKYADWLFKELKYETKEDWYKIRQTIIQKKYGYGLLDIYNNSYQEFLENVYPDYEWIPWKFTSQVPRNYWSNIENHKKYADWLFKELGYKKIEDWYKITTACIHNNYGQGLLLSKYKDSTQLFVEKLNPQYVWVPWKFSSGVPPNYWNNIENQKKYADWLFKELGYKKIEDWYNIMTKTIQKNHGYRLLNIYKDSKQQFLQAVYPEYEWDLSKFKKNYSYGQIEWLEYLRVSTTDIRHAVNNTNGEYSIPNSKYSADGYSETENKIFEYDGDFWHGNPQIYNQQDINRVTKTTFGELYEKTQKKKQFCINNGYKYVSIWESEWLRGKNAVRKLQKKWRKK